MSGLVLELQQDIIKSNCDIVNVLRKAHLIAVKLGLTDFDQWITYELNGYPSQEECPKYRTVHCELKAFNPRIGWIPTIQSNPQIEEAISEKCIAQPISEIITLITNNKSGLIARCKGFETEGFNKIFNNPLNMQYAYHISNSAVADIVEKVKNTLLEWTLKLEEKGIVGDNMMFNDKEKEQAKSISQTINNYYGSTNIVNGSAEHSQIISGNENNISISMADLNSELDKIAEKVSNESNMSKEDIETALELLSDIRNKIDSNKKPSIIKSSLVGLKDFLITAGGGLVANLLHTLIVQFNNGVI